MKALRFEHSGYKKHHYLNAMKGLALKIVNRAKTVRSEKKLSQRQNKNGELHWRVIGQPNNLRLLQVPHKS